MQLKLLEKNVNIAIFFPAKLYHKIPEDLETLDAETQGGSAFNYQKLSAIYLVYVIESAAYGVVFKSCLCRQPERTKYERVSAFNTNKE